MQQLKLLIVLFLLFIAKPKGGPEFTRYKAVESYEIKPGILIMPRYSHHGQICEIGVEKRLYSPERVSVDPTMPRKKIQEVFDELVPMQVRGPLSKDFGDDLIFPGARSITTTIGYQNVVLQIFSERLLSPHKNEIVEGDIAAKIQWRNRTCN